MALDIAADITANMFDSDEFGLAATYTPVGGSGTACTVNLDEGVQRVGDDGESISTADEISFDPATIAAPKHGAKVVFTVSGDTYVLGEQVEGDGYMIRLKAVKQP